MEHTSPHEHSGQHSEHLKPEVDQFFRQEGLSEEHWQRIYDLRYCSILVPLVDDTGKKKHARQDSPSPKRKASPPQDTPHLPTPTTTPRAVSRPFASPTGRPTVAPPPPIRYLPKDPQGEQEEEEEEARPLKKRMLDADHAQDDVMEIDGDDEQGNMSEDSFHDALDTSEIIPSRHHTPSPHLQDPSHISLSQPSSTVSSKRQHWEVATSTPLILQQRTPSVSHEPPRIVTPPIFKRPSEPVSLQRPRLIEPANVTHFNRIPMAQDRTPSVSSRSSHSSWASVDAMWTDQNWQDLEALYVAMEGDLLAEKELGTIAERFLAEYSTRTGEVPPWSKVGNSHVTPVSIATWRSNIGQDPPKSSVMGSASPTLTPYTPLQTQRKFQGATSSYRSHIRSSKNPYPVHRLRRNWTPQRSVSPAPSQTSVASSSSSFVRRAHHYNRMDEDHLPGYQIKSVFKRKLAAGLKTVGELIPFWREVEDGKTDIKEEVVVPLVKAPKVQSMIESFEYLEDLSASGMEMIKQDEETMSRRSSLLSSHSSSSSVRSVAEMISEGHARRVSEAEQT
ncbi:hypothetical protein BGZ81_000688 [Podila clonocystis]|nr:hypothetical protein BGZ81_000688 [Podila clonocystis]